MLTQTTTALLEGLGDSSNERVWSRFDERYRPILIAFARRFGVSDSDAADVAQEAIVRFLTAYREGKYQRDQGRLRSWIIGFVRNCARDHLARKGRRREDRGESAIIEQPQEADLDRAWNEACDHEILRRAMDQLRESSRTDRKTIEAFERVAFGGASVADVARDLKMTTNDVYLAKHRCLSRLRAIISQLSAVYDL